MKAWLSILVLGLSTSSVFCQSSQKATPQDIFWDALQALCGHAYQGMIVHVPENDTLFTGKDLVIHIKACEGDRIRIPLMVGENRSRTWVLTRSEDQITLKHDHRHEDGSEDQITQYGGRTTNVGLTTLQVFPADQHTAELIPAAASNVWWIELVPGAHLTYSLRRLGTERFFSIRFDLTKTVAVHEAPWGWKD